MSSQFVTIDTDNAVIRFNVTHARAAGLTEDAIKQLRTDLTTLASGVAFVTRAEFILQVVV
jgi:hypothetical protein